MKWAYVLCDWGSLKNDDSAACHGQVGNQPDFFVVQVMVFGLLLDKLGDLVFQAASTQSQLVLVFAATLPNRQRCILPWAVMRRRLQVVQKSWLYGAMMPMLPM